MSDCLCEINVSDIDVTDERYKICFSEDDISFLARSIQETGLIMPPLVRPLDDQFIIISGFNRIRALVHNGTEKILVYKTKSDKSEYQCLLASITSLAFKRPLTQAELIICVGHLFQYMTKDEIAKKSSAILNQDLNARFIGDLLAIGDLPEPALELIHNGHLSFKAGKRISSYGIETIMVFLKIFSKIKASNNKQLEIIQHTMEIAARDTIGPKDILQNQDMQTLLLDKNKDPGLKANLVRTRLFAKRFPTIFKTREKVQKKIAAVKLCNTIKFVPPENFESPYYTISFSAKNFDEFEANTHHLKHALDKEALKEVFTT